MAAMANNACVPAKTLLWEGQLTRDTLTVGDLPASLQAKVVIGNSRQKKKPPVIQTSRSRLRTPCRSTVSTCISCEAIGGNGF
jgi:hypothetical protein